MINGKKVALYQNSKRERKLLASQLTSYRNYSRFNKFAFGIEKLELILREVVGVLDRK